MQATYQRTPASSWVIALTLSPAKGLHPTKPERYAKRGAYSSDATAGTDFSRGCVSPVTQRHISLLQRHLAFGPQLSERVPPYSFVNGSLRGVTHSFYSLRADKETPPCRDGRCVIPRLYGIIVVMKRNYDGTTTELRRITAASWWLAISLNSFLL